MHHAWRFSLPEGVTVRTVRRGTLLLESPWLRFRWTGLDDAARDAIGRLAFPGTRLLASPADDAAAVVSSLATRLGRLAERGLLWIAVDDPTTGTPLATLTTSTSAAPLRDVDWPVRSQRFVLSRFACLRRRGEFALVETPLSDARVVLHDPAVAALLPRLAQPLSADRIREAPGGLPAGTVDPLVELLAAAGLIVPVDAEGTTSEDAHPQLRFWEFHDLLFHAHSRFGRHADPIGGTFPWAGIVDPPPAVAPLPTGERIALPPVDLAALRSQDPPFAEVVERRRSVREYGPQPPDVAQLGEFLFRVARVSGRQHLEYELPGGPVALDVAARPYPSGGGLYELDVHVLVRRCDGLAAGFYRYDAEGHALVRHAAGPEDVENLASDAAGAVGIEPRAVQVLIVLTARLPRLAWKYSSIAYALILKHVGVVLQSMYLAATAMGLAPCAVGSGNPDLFARATGADPHGETSVGEFLLGSLPPSGSARDSGPEEQGRAPGRS